ncbi:TraX family protein [Vagococcus lutrae]|uniref:TraX family protein n=1 Tax=Vagococcus lutrae TaxID=81947 RepID=UPI0035DB9929
MQVSLLMALALIVGLRGNWIQAAMGFAALPIALYNGAEGKKMKWFFYIFYPAHIAVIYLVATWFFF